MSDTRITPPNRDEDALFAYGDRLADGEASAPTNDLEATAARVQQALRGDEPHRKVMPAALKSAIWEDIMHSAASGAAQAPANPWSPATGRSVPRSTGTRRRLPYPRTMWMGTANIALALLIVLAGVGVWRGLGGFGSSGNGGDEPTRIPGVAMQPATPETETAPEAATPAPITACDLSGDIPIIPDLAEDESPVTTTSLYVVRYDPGLDYRGDLRLGCEGQESVTLAENVISVWQGPWAGTVAISTLPPDTDDLAEQQTSYVNFVTGKSVTFGTPASESQVSMNAQDGSPWVIGASQDDPDALAIADLRTMETRPLNEAMGFSLRSGTSVMVSTPADDGTIAVGVAEGNYSGKLKTAADAPGNLLLLGSSFGDTRWLTVPDTLRGIGAITLSPDGQYAAVVAQGGGEQISEAYSYAVVSTIDGTVIGQSAAIPRMDNPFVTWIQDGTAVAYLAGNELQTISVDGAGEPETIFRANQQLMRLQTTRDPNVAVAITREDHGSDADPNSTDVDMVYAINVRTGEVREFAGMDASGEIGWISDAGALVLYQWDDAYPDTMTYQVLDPVTGDQIGEIAGAPSVQPQQRTLPTIGPNSIAVSADGRVEVIGLGTHQIYAFIAGGDGMAMSRVDSPEGLLAEVFLTANVFLSPDGTMLSLTGEEDEGRTRYLIALDDPDATWLEIPNNVVGERGRGMITFAKGLGD